MKTVYFLPILFLIIIIPLETWAQEISQSMEGAMDIKIEYPENAVLDRTISISVLVKNNGWEDKQDISFTFSNQDNAIIPVSTDKLVIEKLSQGGSFGSNIDFKISENASIGTHFLNVKYSQTLVVNNQSPKPPLFHDIAIPINIKNQPNVIVSTKTPESIFTNAEFPFTVEVISQDIDIKDVSVKIIPPENIDFRGETLHTFSTIQKDTPIGVTSRIITPQEEVITEHKIPFQIIVEYTDDIGEENSESKTVSLVLRPRTFMELTTDGGIWIGDFFIAPYVSLGTIIGIPAGSIITLIIRRKTSKPKKRKRKAN